jgi:hypothetical protein
MAEKGELTKRAEKWGPEGKLEEGLCKEEKAEGGWRSPQYLLLSSKRRKTKPPFERSGGRC